MRERTDKRKEGPSTIVLGLTLVLAPMLPAMGAEPADLEAYQKKGLEAAMQLKGALGTQLKAAMESGGPPGAVAFCNARALPITRETSESLGARVTRVSDRPRNPANAATGEEIEIIVRFKEALARGAQPVPEVRGHDESVVGYYPIVTNAMCLKCHGAPGADIDDATQAIIDSRYPDDRATGYGEKELRGLFVVTMGREEDDPAD